MLVSGSGTNLQALIDAPDIDGRLRVLEPGATRGGLAAGRGGRTAGAGLGRRGARRATFLGPATRVGLVVCAGYMRILSPDFVAPVLRADAQRAPVAAAGLSRRDAVDGRLAHGVRVTGVTVHLVDEIT